MSYIADFLRARYAERREAAKLVHEIACDEVRHEGLSECDCGQPEAVITDLDAKLALVDVHSGPHRCPAYDQYGDGPRFVDPTPQQVTDCCTTLRILAQPFAGHSDHKGEEWAP